MQQYNHTETQFVSNNKTTNTIVLKELQRELLWCDRFYMSVAFITMSGITMILQQLKELEEKGVSGRILTSEYQYFNDPKVFEKMLRIPNVEVRVYTKESHHTKGYIFEKGTERSIIIGSSNLTANALKTNKEWNLKIEKHQEEKVIENLSEEFEEMWESSHILTSEWIVSYTQKYNESRVLRTRLKKIEKERPIILNKMQSDALRNLDYLRSIGETRALLISATGTGKTYLSAFDVRNSGAKKALFIIHREQIARDAERTFKKVMPEKSTGILSGTKREIDRDFVFTTIQTLSKDTTLNQFDKNHFDYIIFDEAHRSAANSYKKVMDYFNPKFMLGMTATPRRTDGTNVAEMFEFNIAYEIYLNDALEKDMLVPFHYFGVSDVTVNGEVISDQTKISDLVTNHRIDSIVKEARYYGYSGNRVKGLIFCKDLEEAFQISKGLNERGLNTVALTGSVDQRERESTIRRLTQFKRDLDYIVSVDVFNEGIDIPEINQIIMLRPTESAIIFVQQLGRGLRKNQEKEYLVVIDFIGNYKNNFLIPIALSGDRSYNKNNLRKYLMEGSLIVPGASTIEFDTVTKERIYESVGKQNFSTRIFLKTEYIALKEKLGRIPKPIDFLDNNTIDLKVVFNYKSYHNFVLLKNDVEPTYSESLSSYEHNILSFVTSEFSNGKRTTELELIQRLMDKDTLNYEELLLVFDESTLNSALRYLTLEFSIDQERKKYGNIKIIKSIHQIQVTDSFRIALENNTFRSELRDIIEYGMEKSKREYHNVDDLGMQLWEQYTRKDASWLLNWETNQKGTINGYVVNRKTKTIPLFVTYNKESNVDPTINYHDRFVNKDTFAWTSRKDTKLDHKQIQDIIHAQERGYRILLFVQKSKVEKYDYYYLGEVNAYDPLQTVIPNTKTPVVEFTLKLKNPVRDDLYYYLIED